MPNRLPSYFHLHLISDATGETLTTMAKAAAVQYSQVRPIEHVHPLVRTEKQLERVLKEVEQAPGIVLYTIVKRELIEEIERRCRELKVPALHVLQPIMNVFESYLGAPQTPVVAGQHIVDADYFRRIDALNFSMAHDDGQLPQDLERRRHYHPGRLAHLQDADQHLSGPARLQDRQSASGARHRAAVGADRSRTRPSWWGWWPAPSASPRFAATACACCPTATSTTMSIARRSPTRSPTRVGCARGTVGPSSM